MKFSSIKDLEKKIPKKGSFKHMLRMYEDGRIVKGVNTTADVGPDEIKKQAAKFGNKVDKDGRPPTLSKKVKGSSTNVLYNLGMVSEGKSPHKKGSKKYKKHMAAKHAAMGEAQLYEELKDLAPNSKVFVDMDGVLADFFGSWAKLMGKKDWRQIDDIPAGLDKIKKKDNFWLDLPLTSNAKNLLALIKLVKGKYTILSSPLPGDPNSEPHKREWIKNNLNFFPPENVIITHDKQNFATNNDGSANVLIDDYGTNIQKWESAGGVGFKHKDHKFERTANNIKKAMASEKGVEEDKDSKSCPPATQDLALNTKNRDATLKNFNYGPLNVDEPGDYWKKIGEYWKTTEKAARKSTCGVCVAFDISPRMDDCMPGETSDEDGRLGYCWMHHFKCHSARSCHTWAKGGPITDDEKSYDWQERGEKEVDEGKMIPNPKNSFAAGADTAYDYYKLGVNMANLKSMPDNSNVGEPDIMISPYAGKKEMKYLMKQLKRLGYTVGDVSGYQDTHINDEGIEPPQVKNEGRLGKVKLSKLRPVQKKRKFKKLFSQLVKVGEDNYSPITIDRTGKIVNGHHRYDALRLYNQEYAKVRMLDKTLEEVMDEGIGDKLSSFADKILGKMEKWWNKQVDAHEMAWAEVEKILKPYAEELRDLIKDPNDFGMLMLLVKHNQGKKPLLDKLFAKIRQLGIKAVYKMQGLEDKFATENFADGKKKGRKGLAKRKGVNCKQSVTKLRRIAKNSSGERQRMAHWCANMKSGKKKK